MEVNNPLGTAPVGELIRKFALPSMLSLLVSAAYNITDQIFIGHMVGMLGNAATNVSFPVVSLCTALAQLIGVGTAANFNICQGRKDSENAKRYIGTGLVMSVILGVLLGILILVFKTPILVMCGATEQVLPYAQLYLGITALGLPFLLFSNCNSILVRADGSPKWSMTCMVTGALINVFLDWLFMSVFSLGIQGAALATIISQIISFGLCLSYFFRFRSFKIERSMLSVRIEHLKAIAKLGVSNFINHIVMMTVNIVLNNTLKHYGALSIYGSDIPLAVAGIVSKIYMIMVAFTVGLSQGCQPIFSFNMGAKNYDRVKETYIKAVKIAAVIGIVAFVIFQTFPRQVTSIFGNGDVLYFEFAAQYLKTYLFCVFLTGIQPLTVNYFTSVGNVKSGIILSLSRQGLFLLPLILVLPTILGLDGVLYAGPIAEVMAFIWSMSMMKREFKRLEVLKNSLHE